MMNTDWRSGRKGRRATADGQDAGQTTPRASDWIRITPRICSRPKISPGIGYALRGRDLVSGSEQRQILPAVPPPTAGNGDQIKDWRTRWARGDEFRLLGCKLPTFQSRSPAGENRVGERARRTAKTCTCQNTAWHITPDGAGRHNTRRRTRMSDCACHVGRWRNVYLKSGVAVVAVAERP